jgi:hypothetical protein
MARDANSRVHPGLVNRNPGAGAQQLLCLQILERILKCLICENH